MHKASFEETKSKLLQVIQFLKRWLHISESQLYVDSSQSQ